MLTKLGADYYVGARLWQRGETEWLRTNEASGHDHLPGTVQPGGLKGDASSMDLMLPDTVKLIHADAWRMQCLEIVTALDLPDWYIGAGFLRNAIWDLLHDKPARTPLNDVDVVYFDPVDVTPAAEARTEAVLQARCPEVTWEVRNQARMHLRNGHAPYRDTAHAIAHWPDTPGCIGVRLEPDERLTVVAPFSLAENWSLRVSPNPLVHYPAAVFNERVRSKRWLEHWPKLQVEWAREV